MIDADEASALAQQWWEALADTRFVPTVGEHRVRVLTMLVQRLAIALDDDPFDAEVGAAVGRAVAAYFTLPSVATRSARVLALLPDKLHGRSEREYRIRLAELLGTFGDGCAATLQQRADALRDSEIWFRVVFDNAPVAIAVSDTVGRILVANTALAVMLGVPEDHIRGARVDDFVHPDDRADLQARIRHQLVVPGHGSLRQEVRFQTDHGPDRWGSLAVTFVAGGDGQHDYLLTVGEDITERHRLQLELHHQARHDPLTGLPNRLSLRETLADLAAEAGPQDRVGLCFLDLDDFKVVNDRYGHGVGDRLLAAVAARLAGAHVGGLLTRLGGDEFVAVIPAPTTDDDTIAVAENLLRALAAPFTIDGHRLRISASVGVSAPRVAGAEPAHLIDVADRGMYRAKSAQPGTWALAHHPPHTRNESSRP
ncbi:MAG: diguanylate cyclase [Mycobacteriaceae bacterium]|nr:diguanylate cyclase [Mycobacteriaceae bacterium]